MQIVSSEYHIISRITGDIINEWLDVKIFVDLFVSYIKRALAKEKQKHVKKNSACRQTLQRRQ